MILRGLLVVLSGFLFIFIPGLPMRLLARPGRAAPRGLLYWGMLVWMVALLLGLFFQSLLRQVIQAGAQALSGQPIDYALTLVSALVEAFFLETGVYWMLRWKRSDSGDAAAVGLTLGYGVGLIYQVFTGLALVGAGFRLTFGDTSEPTLAALAHSPLLDLCLGLLAMILFRLALLVVRGALGMLVGRAAAGRIRFLWLAMLVDTGFTWVILAIQLAVSRERPGQILAGQVDATTAAVTAAYYLLVFLLAYRWLQTNLLTASPEAVGQSPKAGRARAAARKG
ncbi:MAG: hypothetical protein AB1449_06475 [Chloroflexota bacterium]